MAETVLCPVLELGGLWVVPSISRAYEGKPPGYVPKGSASERGRL